MKLIDLAFSVFGNTEDGFPFFLSGRYHEPLDRSRAVPGWTGNFPYH